MLNLKFLFEFFKHPSEIGSIIPSSKYLAQGLVDNLSESTSESSIMEIGPGTGSTTKYLYDWLKTKENLYCFEINSEFAKIIQADYPDINVINTNIIDINSVEGLPKFSYAICGIPITLLSKENAEQLYLDILDKVEPEGYLLQYTYSPKKIISSKKFEVTRAGCIIKNIPPAYIYKVKLAR